MTLEGLIQDLRDLLQEPSPTGRFSNEELTRYIESGARRVATDLKLLMDEKTVTVPAGSLSTGLPPDYVAFFEWVKEPPVDVEIVGQQVLLSEAQEEDLDLTFRYFRLPSSVTEIPDRYHDGILYAAVWLCFVSDLDPRQDKAEERYFRWLLLAQRQEAAATHRQPTRIRVSRR